MQGSQTNDHLPSSDIPENISANQKNGQTESSTCVQHKTLPPCPIRRIKNEDIENATPIKESKIGTMVAKSLRVFG
ncbi:MAG: hypothetical protein ACKOAH_17980, partial [Pirellula sp.]